MSDYPGGKIGGVPKFNPENVAFVERSNAIDRGDGTAQADGFAESDPQVMCDCGKWILAGERRVAVNGVVMHAKCATVDEFAVGDPDEAYEEWWI